MISFALQYLAIVQRISVVFLNSVSSECYRISSPLTKTNSGKIKNFFFFYRSIVKKDTTSNLHWARSLANIAVAWLCLLQQGLFFSR